MNDFHVYLQYRNRPDLTINSIASLGGLFSDLTVVDNSHDGKISGGEGDPPWSTTYRPTVPMTFTFTHNWFFADAKARGCKFLIWAHSDGESVDGTHLKLSELARQYTAEGRKWGLIWTNYDTIAAVNLDMIEDIGGYDTIFSKYFCDNDHTYRMRLKGWETIESGLPAYHHGSQTIKSDPRLGFMNDQTFDWYAEYYVKKWGGMPGKEVYTVPFNNHSFADLKPVCVW